MLVGLRLRHDRGFGVSVEGASFSGAYALRESGGAGLRSFESGAQHPIFLTSI